MSKLIRGINIFQDDGSETPDLIWENITSFSSGRVLILKMFYMNLMLQEI